VNRTLLATALLAATAVAPHATAAPDPCRPWAVNVLATGLGSLENVEPDGRDGLVLSASTAGAVQRLTRDGAVRTLAAAKSPGGLRVRGDALFFTTGDAAQSGALGTADGTIERLDLRTGKRRTWATGLTMPNGLAFLPDGSAVTSRDVAGLSPTGITRVRKEGAAPQERWSDQADSNGLAVDPTGRWLYSDETFTATSYVYRTEIARPAHREVVASLAPRPAGVPKGLDDLTLSSSGVLYLAANSAGEVLRLDPVSKRSCVIASGLTNTSAVKQGRGRSFPASRLYVTGFDGRVLELVPPAGVRP
jgi:sugar lactone lactonase YvrE